MLSCCHTAELIKWLENDRQWLKHTVEAKMQREAFAGMTFDLRRGSIDNDILQSLCSDRMKGEGRGSQHLWACRCASGLQ